MTANRIKVLHLITGLDTGGAEVSLQRLTGAMDRERFENVVVSLTTLGPLGAAIRDQGIRVDAIHMSRALPSPTAVWRLYHLLRAERPDVLQTWLYHSDLIGTLTGRAARVPAIAWNIRCSHMGEKYRRGINSALIKVLARLSKYPDAIVANSLAGQKEHIALGYKPKRWEVLSNGFDLTVFKPDGDAKARLRHELGLVDNSVLIGLVGRYDPMKDHAGFLRAVAELSTTDMQVHFILAGGGVDRGNEVLNALIEQLGIRDRVHLLGQREDIPRLTAGLDIATCCSLGEGFPNVVGEAMGCAIPCVVTDVGDSAQIVGDTGIVVPPGDPKALAHAWSKLLAAGDADRKVIGQRAHALIDSRYSLAQCAENYQNFYEDLVELSMRK
jgi:glycosyltransferase involved in cell wall biosynthesis